MTAAGPARVLLVDDDPVVLDVLTAVLDSAECEIVVARDGRDALRIAADRSPDVVVLDVMMPGMTGFEVCRHIRHMPGLEGVRVVMLTALDTAAAREEAARSGADAFLTKPFSALDLLGAVSTAGTRVAG